MPTANPVEDDDFVPKRAPCFDGRNPVDAKVYAREVIVDIRLYGRGNIRLQCGLGPALDLHGGSNVLSSRRRRVPKQKTLLVTVVAVKLDAIRVLGHSRC